MTIAVLKKSYVRDKLDPRIAEILSDRSTEALAPAWRDLKSFRSVFWRNPSIVLSTLGINLLSIALPLVMLQIYQRIIPNQASHTFAFLLLGLAFVVLLDGLLRVARSYAIAWQGAALRPSELLPGGPPADVRLAQGLRAGAGRAPPGRPASDRRAAGLLWRLRPDQPPRNAVHRRLPGADLPDRRSGRLRAAWPVRPVRRDRLLSGRAVEDADRQAQQARHAAFQLHSGGAERAAACEEPGARGVHAAPL